MSRYATTVQIAGVNWSGESCALILDGTEFVDSEKGTSDWALDSTPFNYVFDTQFKGAPFGINLTSRESAGLLITKVNQTLAAIKAQKIFTVLYTDEMYVLNVKAKRDFTQKWYSHGPFSEGYVEQVAFRFLVEEKISVALSS